MATRQGLILPGSCVRHGAKAPPPFVAVPARMSRKALKAVRVGLSPMQKTKAESMRIHAKKRAWQRLRLSLNRADLEAVCAAIRASPPRAKFVLRTSKNRTRWEIDIKGRRAIVVYDKKRKTVVTFWPAPSADEQPRSS